MFFIDFNFIILTIKLFFWLNKISIIFYLKQNVILFCLKIKSLPPHVSFAVLVRKMFSISKIYSDFLTRNFTLVSPIMGENISSHDIKKFEDLDDTLSCFSFTLVLEGWARLNYGGAEIRINRNDLHIYMPGTQVKALDVSENFRGVTVMADEDYVRKINCLDRLLHIVFSPYLSKNTGLLPVPPEISERIITIIYLIVDFSHSSDNRTADSIVKLFQVFTNEIINILEINVTENKLTENVENIFSNFFELAKDNYKTCHDIGFYADKLNITTIYLSRIVKKVTGRTVMDFINRLLLTEASWLLANSDKSMAQITEHLNFATQAGFSKFFKTSKGLSPLKYRQRYQVKSKASKNG